MPEWTQRISKYCTICSSCNEAWKKWKFTTEVNTCLYELNSSLINIPPCIALTTWCASVVSNVSLIALLRFMYINKLDIILKTIQNSSRNLNEVTIYIVNSIKRPSHYFSVVRKLRLITELRQHSYISSHACNLICIAPLPQVKKCCFILI